MTHRRSTGSFGFDVSALCGARGSGLRATTRPKYVTCPVCKEREGGTQDGGSRAVVRYRRTAAPKRQFVCGRCQGTRGLDCTKCKGAGWYAPGW